MLSEYLALLSPLRFISRASLEVGITSILKEVTVRSSVDRILHYPINKAVHQPFDEALGNSLLTHASSS